MRAVVTVKEEIDISRPDDLHPDPTRQVSGTVVSTNEAYLTIQLGRTKRELLIPYHNVLSVLEVQ